MIISLIVAMDKKRGIGFQNKLPWAGKIPRDMARFKELTTGRPIVMGRKTFQSIGRPLPNRTNIVLTRDHGWSSGGIRVAHSLSEALTGILDTEVFIVGGSELFREALPFANRLYVTEIEGEFISDTFFPEYDPSEWVQVSLQIHPPDKDNFYELRFFNYIRKTA